MSRKIGIFFIIFIIILIIFFSVRYFFLTKKKIFDYSEVILKIDNKINTHAYKEAKLTLNKVNVKKLTLVEIKSFLQRCFKYSSSVGNYNLLVEKSYSALKKYPKDSEIANVYFYALLKDGQTDNAVQFVQSYKGIVSNSLMLELDFYKKPSKQMQSALMLPLDSKSISVFDTAAKITEDSGYEVDKALILLENGEYLKACKLLRNMDVTIHGRNELFFFSAYKAGNYSDALKILNKYNLNFNINTLYLLKADLLMSLGEYPKAIKLYRKIIKTSPELSWIPYANSGWVAADTQKEELIPEIIKGFKYFPRNTDLLYSIVASLLKLKDYNKTVDLINLYGRDEPVLTIIKLTLRNPVESDLLIARLQESLSGKDVSDTLKKYYCWYLVNTGNFSLLQNYLKNEKKERENKAWFNFFKGITYIYTGNITQAEEVFRDSYKAKKRWELLFDIGLLSLYEKEYKKAIVIFQNAENDISVHEKSNSSERSYIRTYTAKTLFALGNRKNAIRELKYALELDRSNTAALIELEKIKRMKTN